MSFLAILGWTWVLLAVCVTLVWLWSLRLQDASIIDVFWGLGFAFATTFFVALHPTSPNFRQILLLSLVWIWALRLSGYIGWRNWGRGEDPRYQAFRKAGGAGFWWKSLFFIFLLQSSLICLISTPLLFAQYGPPSWTPFDTLGLLLWLLGFSFETIADLQLSRFKANPNHRGQLFTSGLWRWSRHPNYFGEATLWFGFFSFALPSPNGWLSLFSPLLMLFLLLRVSGVSLLETSLRSSKPGYLDYTQRTSPFFPWPPRS